MIKASHGKDYTASRGSSQKFGPLPANVPLSKRRNEIIIINKKEWFGIVASTGVSQICVITHVLFTLYYV